MRLMEQMRSRDSIISDGEAFKRFYAEEREGVLRYFAKRVLDPELALDLTSEVFAQTFLDRGRFRGSDRDAARAWLYSIARGRLVDYYRRGAAEKKALRKLGIELPPAESEELARVEELAGLDRERSMIREGLRSLSEEQRSALTLRIVEERSYAEVASGLGVSEQTARARVSRALGALQRTLQPDQPIEEIR